MSSIFTKIIEGSIPCYKIAENDLCFAFLDISPLAKGHLLVVPKKEVDYLFDLDVEHYNALFSFAKEIAIGLKQSIPCKKVGMTVLGLEVPHAHIHLVPMQNEGDLNFSNPKLQFSDDEFKEIADLISKNI